LWRASFETFFGGSLCELFECVVVILTDRWYWNFDGRGRLGREFHFGVRESQNRMAAAGFGL
jgi:hypothetical protein